MLDPDLSPVLGQGGDVSVGLVSFLCVRLMLHQLMLRDSPGLDFGLRLARAVTAPSQRG